MEFTLFLFTFTFTQSKPCFTWYAVERCALPALLSQVSFSNHLLLREQHLITRPQLDFYCRLEALKRSATKEESPDSNHQLNLPAINRDSPAVT